MPTLNNNVKLNRANQKKDDEFYTRHSDIVKELRHYRHHFANKRILCNCDDYKSSEFVRYFAQNFDELQLRSVSAICLSSHTHSELVQITQQLNDYDNAQFGNAQLGNGITKTLLPYDGDFRHQHSLDMLCQHDIIITNPPFSLFKEFVAILMAHQKDFLIIGNSNAVTYKDCFEHIKTGAIKLGHHSVRWFTRPDGTQKEGARSYWFTNLSSDTQKPHLPLKHRYLDNPSHYPPYDNYDAIEVEKTKEIPCDYAGVMGVPVTFLEKYTPSQFCIVGASESEGKGFSCGLWHLDSTIAQPMVNNKKKFKRIFIKLNEPL